MADVIVVKGGASGNANRVRRSNSTSYGGGGSFGLSQEDMLKAGALVVGGLVIGYFGLQYLHRQGPTLDWSDLFTPPYSINPPAKVPPTIVQSAYVDMAPEAGQIEEMNANMVISEGEDEAGAASVIVEPPDIERAPNTISYAVARYETQRDRNGDLIGLNPI